MPELTLNLSGTFSMAIDGVPVTAFRTDKARALLAYLAVEADVVHRRSALAALFWDTLDDSAALANVRNTLSNLNQLLSPMPAVLTITRQTVVFHARYAYVDVVAFSRNPRRHIHDQRGEFLQGLSFSDAYGFEEWRMMQQERLHLLKMTTLDALQQEALSDQAYATAAELARRQLFLEVWHEPAYRTLLQALVAQGQREAARAVYERCRSVLQEELGIAPSLETEALWQRLSRPPQAPSPIVRQPLHNLPGALSPLIGRDRELAALGVALHERQYRLLTITGFGGAGKSRLALEAARLAIGRFADGVWFVPLAAVGSVEAVAPAIADALGLQLAAGQPVAEQLHNRLRDKEMLLVLDNLEQFPAAIADLLSDLLQATRRLIILATSRRRLDLRIEALFPLDGLTFPAAGEAPGGETPDDAYGAIDLFMAQMARLNPFATRLPERAIVGEICRLVEGLPLGIELAVAQTEQQSPEAIAEMLRAGLHALQVTMRDVPPRQRSLRAVFESSWQLLAPPEQAVLAQLSLFRGGFTATAAHAIVPDARPAILTALVHQSLLQVAEAGRYDLHPLVREFAADKLPAETPARRRYSHTYLDLARALEPQWRGVDIAAAQQMARREWANLNAAWQLALDDRAWDLLGESVAALRDLYRFSILYREGAALFGAACDQIQDAAQSPEVRELLGRLYAARLWFLVQLHDHAGAEVALTTALAYATTPALRLDVQVSQQILLTQQDRLAESLALADRLLADAAAHDAPLVAAHARLDAGFVMLVQGDYARGRDLLQAAEAGFRAAGDTPGTITALRNVGLAHMVLREMELAEAHLLEALDLARRRNDGEREHFVIDTLGSVYYQSGDYGRAVDAWQQRLAYVRTLGLEADISACLANLGLAYAALGQYDQALATFDETLPRMAAVESRANYCSALVSVAMLHMVEMRFAPAQAHCEQAIALAQRHGLRRTEGDARSILGRVLQDQNAIEAAAQQVEQALEIRIALGETAKALQCRAELAAIALARGDRSTARQQVDTVLSGNEYLRFVSPHQLLYRCFVVLRALDDSRAAATLAQAHALLLESAGRIQDAGYRRSFLENVPLHRQIMAAVA